MWLSCGKQETFQHRRFMHFWICATGPALCILAALLNTHSGETFLSLSLFRDAQLLLWVPRLLCVVCTLGWQYFNFENIIPATHHKCKACHITEIRKLLRVSATNYVTWNLPLIEFDLCLSIFCGILSSAFTWDINLDYQYILTVFLEMDVQSEARCSGGTAGLVLQVHVYIYIY